MSEVAVPGLGQPDSGASGPTAPHVTFGHPRRQDPRRRPSGAAPPLPHHLHRTGVGWLVGAVVAVIATLVIYRNGVRGAAIRAIVVDDTIVRWISNIDLPGIDGIARGVSYASSWWVIQTAIWLLPVVLIVFRRWRLVVIYVIVEQLSVLVNDYVYD